MNNENSVIPGIGHANTQKLLDLFEREECIASVILYDSRAKGAFQNGSDIDLTLLFTTD